MDEVFDDLNLIEVENGAIYLTSLYNFAQPLIRYRISDHLALKEPLAGSPFTRSEILLGRDEDILWFEDGKGGREFQGNPRFYMPLVVWMRLPDERSGIRAEKSAGLRKSICQKT